MIEKLFVYGTLGPDRPNEHVLDAIGGSWETATVSGTLREEGWGAEMGYPGIDLDEHRVLGTVYQTLRTCLPLHNLIPNWKALLYLSTEEELKILKRHEHTGRPLGRDSFVAKLEKTLGRVLCPRKPGLKKKTAN